MNETTTEPREVSERKFQLNFPPSLVSLFKMNAQQIAAEVKDGIISRDRRIKTDCRNMCAGYSNPKASRFQFEGGEANLSIADIKMIDPYTTRESSVPNPVFVEVREQQSYNKSLSDAYFDALGKYKGNGELRLADAYYLLALKRAIAEEPKSSNLFDGFGFQLIVAGGSVLHKTINQTDYLVLVTLGADLDFRYKPFDSMVPEKTALLLLA